MSSIPNREALDRFMYWIEERHKIYLKRQAGELPPWTKDKVLQTVFFTNPYRENDRTTVWFRENVRGLMRERSDVLMATVIFRWFNRISTGELLLANDLLTAWNEKKAIRLLEKARKNGPVFTGAYMIKPGNGPPGCKVRMVCEAITNVWKERDRLVEVCQEDCRLEALWSELNKFPGLGGFMSYEIVCDLRYTYLLEDATDVDTWANPGPGAVRGLRRLVGLEAVRRRGTPRLGDSLARMVGLLHQVRKRLGKKMPHFELREVEHSLCETDKYERARLGDGKLKRKYNGKG